jgi:hypothetical protein
LIVGRFRWHVNIAEGISIRGLNKSTVITVITKVMPSLRLYSVARGFMAVAVVCLKQNLCGRFPLHADHTLLSREGRDRWRGRWKKLPAVIGDGPRYLPEDRIVADGLIRTSSVCDRNLGAGLIIAIRHLGRGALYISQ